MTSDSRHKVSTNDKATERIAYENDLAEARESIRSEHITKGDTNPTELANIRKNYKESFATVSALITVLVAVGGLFFTIYQFDKTMKAQRHSNAEAAVGQFIAQVTELRTQETLASKQGDLLRPGRSEDMPSSANLLRKPDCSEASGQSHSPLDSFIVSRAQMLIDGEETGRFAGDILRFLTANQYGHYIGVKPCVVGHSVSGPRVTVEGIVLVDSKLTNSTVEGVFLQCMGFEEGVFDNVKFTSSEFQNIYLENSKISSVDFSEAWLGSISFKDTVFEGSNSFDNATLYGVNFLSSRIVDDASFSFNGARILHSNLSNLELTEIDSTDQADFYMAFSQKISNAESLWGTQLPDPVIVNLREILSVEDYEKKIETPIVGLNSENANLNWDWDTHCPPKERRDRRFNATAAESIRQARAFF